jgi:predicted nucleic acid-binding Zn ribbon protein
MPPERANRLRPILSRRRGPRELGHAITSLRKELAPRTLLAAVQECWARAVGEAVSEQAAPVAERGGTITVQCRSAVWASELSLLGEALIERLNRSLGQGRRVRSLKFTVGPLER